MVEVIDGLDLTAMSKSYRGTGSASYHPAPLLGLLVYGYATGVLYSRELERATHDSVAFRFIAANDHPDHDTIATFRRRFLPEIEALFVKVLLLAREMGVLRMGTVALDGTKIHANASRHSALSYEQAGKIEAQLKAEVADLLARAEAADQTNIPDGMAILEELARREDRLEKLAAARAKIEARARERFARELAEHEAKLAARAAKTAVTGKKPGERAVRRWAAAAREPDTGGSHGAPVEDRAGPRPLCVAQTNPGAGVWDHQIRDGLPAIHAARHRPGSRRMETCDHGLEHQADVRSLPPTVRSTRYFRVRMDSPVVENSRHGRGSSGTDQTSLSIAVVNEIHAPRRLSDEIPSPTDRVV